MSFSSISILVYLSLLLSIIFIKRLRSKSEIDFMLGNREVGLFPFVATLVATAYGWILAVGEYYYSYGITAWISLSLPYTIGFIIIALLFANKARSSNYVTITDLLLNSYGKRVANFGTLFFLVYLFPAMYVLMTGQLLQSVLGIDIIWCLLIATTFSMIYVITGGFKAVVFSDMLQFIIMFGGFAAVSIYLISNYGDVAITNEVRQSHLEFNISDSWPNILSWFLLASFTLVDPSVNQRLYSVKSSSVAVKGIFIAVACWFVFDIMEATTGVFTKILLPNLKNPAIAYPELAEHILPDTLSGIFILGMLAVIMSTTDSFLFLSALTISKDVFKSNGILSNLSIRRLTNITLVIISCLTFLVTALYKDSSAITLFFDFAPLTVSVLVIPVICSYYPKLTLKSRQVLIQMVISFVICIGYQLIQAKLPDIFADFNAVYFGLTASVTIQLIFSWYNRK